MTEELKVVLRRSSSEQHSGFGFSLLGTTGPPHVIYDIVENSPAADCGAVEAGDVILKVNNIDVHRYTTKEVLKCLRLSENLVTLELKRDPKLKARIKEQLANTQSPHYVDIESPINIYDYSSSANASPKHQRHHNRGATPPTNAGSPALKYKSPTHLPSLRQNSPTTTGIQTIAASSTTTTSHTHSRNSSASSTKIQMVESTTITTSISNSNIATSPTAGGGGGDATSPTFRPSRIPQALKSVAAPKQMPQVQSPQHKRPRPSQIPTKAANGNGLQPPLQHSNSYSGSPAVNRQRFTDREPEPEPNSAPPQPAKAPRFEAYMMTGDLILNLSKTPQSSSLLTAQAKKVDSLRDFPKRNLANARANGALAPRASGESSPTSSSSVDSPTNTASSDSVKRDAKLQRCQQQQQQQQRDSINNSYNRRDSLTNDTLLMCEELERDEDATVDYDDNKRQQQRQQQQQQQQQQRYRQQQHQQQQQQQQRYEYYQNEDELEADPEEREEDQTHYDITNIETYQSGLGRGDEDDSDRQCLVDDDDDDDYNEEDNDAGDEEYSTNSLGSGTGSAKQRMRALKQRSVVRQQQQRNRDAIDCAARATAGYSASTSNSSGTVKSEAVLGLCQDETSFSVPTSPISLSAPLIDKETASSVPTSPEPSSLAVESSNAAAGSGGAVVVRRHNGHVVRKCDAAGFRTSKSEDHLQQVQREGIAAVIPIDIDEDVNSSLNTLLDTRHDSEDSQSTTTTTSTSATTIINNSNNNKENVNESENVNKTSNHNHNNKNNNNNNHHNAVTTAIATTTTTTTATTSQGCSNKLNYILRKKVAIC
ncbi:putative uncharacterized protein DDB_G0271606 isoform X4 [Drosophila innubila]|uniref:putative uncharacterized protein DDB_G0271606 isoform X4 n=1 Tax=Drosophila innubila TaxID=198719 RepID=UPI00148C34D0|nr:putative uncharacterized protein DDB_G0271606 isoform X4 [Drosophila innubila]